MRIVGGEYRGRVLLPVKTDNIRPTSDMARESLFNILRDSISGAYFLDLFCGTGAMGIEGLSRGASKVMLNDISGDSVKLAKANIEHLKLDGDISVTRQDALLLLDTTPTKFDIVYIDPPYKSNIGETAVIKAKRVLTDDGVIILESEQPFTKELDGLKIVDRRRYGRVHLTFFKRDGE